MKTHALLLKVSMYFTLFNSYSDNFNNTAWAIVASYEYFLQLIVEMRITSQKHSQDQGSYNFL